MKIIKSFINDKNMLINRNNLKKKISSGLLCDG